MYFFTVMTLLEVNLIFGKIRLLTNTHANLKVCAFFILKNVLFINEFCYNKGCLLVCQDGNFFHRQKELFISKVVLLNQL